jgi:CHASE2 domain-containing sensor protein
MLDRQKSWRLFIASLPLQALSIGVVVTLLSATLWSVVPVTFTALDHTVYDTWVRHLSPIGINPLLTIIARDPVSEERFGTGPWDRAILAELIVAVHEAGASVIGIDHRLDHASPAQLGEAASDALLLEALCAASPVVLTHDPDSLLRPETTRFGHVAVGSDLDHISRHVLLSANVGT